MKKNEAVISTVRQRGDSYTITLKTTSEEEAKGWRDRMGQKVGIPRTSRNALPSECKCVVTRKGRKVHVALNRPWQFSSEISAAGTPWEMEVDAVTVIFNFHTSLVSAKLLESYFVKKAPELNIPDRSEFANTIMKLAKKEGVGDKASVTVRHV